MTKKTPIQRARAKEYASHYECRRYFLSLPGDVQERYRALSMVFPEWNLNRFGAIQMDEHQENRLIQIANQHGLQAWYLISFYTSEDGWNQFVGKFNELEEKDGFREPPVNEKEIWMSESTKQKLSTSPVEKNEYLSTYQQAENSFSENFEVIHISPQVIHNLPVDKI